MKQRLYEMCKSAADEIEAVTAGRVRVCDDCGELIEDGATICPSCGGEEIVSMTLDGWFYQNDLGTELTITPDGYLLGAKITITTGGPHIEIDTRRGVVAGYWGGDTAEAGLTDRARDAIEDFVKWTSPSEINLR